MKMATLVLWGSMAVVAGVFVVQYDNVFENAPAYSGALPFDAARDRARFIQSIKTYGPRDAYEQFVEANSRAPLSVRHVRAHVMGEALFETQEIKGIAVCDSNFGFGCFHGLFTVGFASQGRPFVRQADAFCVDRYGVWGTGCQHGIGHGIVEYVGRDRLNDALELCEETSQPTPLLGCTSGVFMEFNTPLTVIPGEEPPEPLPFREEAPYGACEDVPERYRASCYYELGGWWEVVVAGDKEKMGQLCARVADSHLRDMCALGVGNIIGPTTQYDVAQSSDTCRRLPAEVVTLCHAGVAWSMYANPAYRDRAVSMCAQLPERERRTCERTYNLAAQR